MQGFKHIALAASILTFAGAGSAFAESCPDLTSLALPNTEITKAELVGAGAFEPPASPFGLPPGVAPSSFGGMPAFCRINAALTPTPDSDIKVEVWMPAENWNGKLAGIGNGVWAGSISFAQMAEPLSKGYAVAATDTGHVGTGMDVKFAVGHPEKLVDFGHRAIHEMTVTAKSLIQAFYNEAPQYSLWASCSTGGRQGLMAAYRYPDDFDAISAMAPANPMTGLMTQSIWTGNAALKSPANALSPPKLMAVHAAYIQACDAMDGVKDGLASAPEHCDFDPKIVQCQAGDGPDCLTGPQVETMRAVYGGVINPRTGERLFNGFTPGSEAMLGILMAGPEPFMVATSYMRDIVFQDPQWDFKSFDYDKDADAARESWSDALDVPSDGLDAFFAKGGKLLLSHGWADGLIPADNTVAFYEDLLNTLDDETAANSVRLFMVPGMGHCAGGNGPFLFDLLSIVDAWAAGSDAPERIVASRPPEAPAMTRPLCPYPQVAQYSGDGSTNDAANFTCTSP